MSDPELNREPICIHDTQEEVARLYVGDASERLVFCVGCEQHIWFAVDEEKIGE